MILVRSWPLVLAVLVAAVVPAAAGLWLRREALQPRAALRPAVRRWRRSVAVGIATACAAGIMGVALCPVNVAVVNRAAPTITARPASDAPEAAHPYAEMHVSVTLRRGTARVVVLTPPAGRVEAERLGIAAGAWAPEAGAANVFAASDPGDVLRVAGLFQTVDLDLPTGPDGGVVEVAVAGGEAVTFDLAGSAPGVVSLRVDNGVERRVAQSRFWWTGKTFDFGRPFDAVDATSLGSLQVDHSRVDGGAAAARSVHVSRGAVVHALVAGTATAAGLAVLALTLALLGLLAGLAATSTDRRAARTALEHCAVGLAVLMLVVGMLAYVVPVRVGVFAAVPLIGVGSWRWATARRTLVRPVAPDPWAAAAVGGVLTAIGLLYVLTDRWGIGLLETDVFDTFNLTTLFWDHGALAAGTDFGNGFRLLDYSSRAALWGPILRRPSDAIVVLRLLFTAIVVLSSVRLVRRFGGGGVVRLGGGVLIGASAPLVGLYAEGFMSREFFTVWMLIALVMITTALVDDDRSCSVWFGLGACASVSLAIVPPYFLLGPALVAVVATSWRRAERWRHAVARIQAAAIGFGAAIVVLGLPNMFWLRQASDADRYSDALNQIARNLTVPFYGTSTFPSVLLGLVPFHRNERYRLGTARYDVGAVTLGSDSFASTWLLVVALVTVAIGAIASWCAARRGDPPLRRAAAMLAAVVGVYLLGLAALRIVAWTEQTYFVLMWAWTLAPVALAALFLLVVVRGPHGRSRLLSLPVLIGLPIVNVWSAAVESELWLAHPYGELADRWHFDLAPPLERLDEALREDGDLLPTEYFEVAEAPSALIGTDDDRVLINVIVNLLEAHGHECFDCSRNPDVPIVSPSPPRHADRSLVVIGATTCPDRPILHRDERFVVCGPASPSAGDRSGG